MKSFKIQIVEDELIMATYLQFVLSDLGYEVTGVSSNFEDAMKQVEVRKPHLVLLDIKLKGKKTGLDIANELKENKIPFVFITSLYEEEVIKDARSTMPLGYIIKPFTKNDIYSTVEMAIGHIEGQSKGKTLFLPLGRSKVRVEVEDVLYVEAQGSYSTIFDNKNKVILRKTLKQVASDLLHFPEFIRIHKSYLVNFNHIAGKTSGFVILSNGQEIPIGRAYAAELKSAY